MKSKKLVICAACVVCVVLLGAVRPITRVVVAYFAADAGPPLDVISKASADSYFIALDTAVAGKALLAEVARTKIDNGRRAKGKAMVQQARDIAASARVADLNAIFPAWGDVCSEKFIRGLDAFLFAKSDADVTRSGMLLMEFDVWRSKNDRAIFEVLTARGYQRPRQPPAAS